MSTREDIRCFMYTFSNICRSLGVRNVSEHCYKLLGAQNLQFKSNFFTCSHAKYTVLPAQHTRTLKKPFPCLIFGTRMLLKYGKALSIASEFRDMRSCKDAFEIMKGLEHRQ